MNSNQLKLLAVGLMVIDHINRLFLHNYELLYLGALSYPLFAFLAAEGEKNTSNFRSYLQRLIIWGVASQPFYMSFCSYANLPFRLNVLFSLALGVGLIRILKKLNLPHPINLMIISGIGLLLDKILEAGFYELLLIYVCSLNRQSIRFYLSYTWAFLISFLEIAESTHYLYYPRLFGVLSLFFIVLYNGKPGARSKLFYWVYPLHLGFLVLAKDLYDWGII